MEFFTDKVSFNHEIDHNPEPEDAGRINVHASILLSEISDPTINRRTVLVFSVPAKEFLDNIATYRWEQLNCLADEERLNHYHVDRARSLLTRHVSNVIAYSANYSPDWALSMYMTFKTTPPITTEERRRRLVEDRRRRLEEADSIIEEIDAISDEIDSLDEITTDVQFRPASKVVVESLPRKVYKKTTSTSSSDMCTICLSEFKTGERVLTLPCGHEFDDSCILEWFSNNHVCPLCRFELRRENQVKRALEFGSRI